jgi:RNA polymerase sigma-70 factor (ECF subfamily)
MVELSRLLARLMPQEPEVHALAATIRYAEARRAARVDEAGVMIPLAEQDPARWDRQLIAAAEAHMQQAWSAPLRARTLQATIHQAWCSRSSLAEPPPWHKVLGLYDRLLKVRDDPVVRLNRLVALAEVAGPQAALDELGALPLERMRGFLPFHALSADLLRRCGRAGEARGAYATALALCATPAERSWLQRQLAALKD